MNYKLVLKTYAQLRQLTDDETALLNTLRGMSESERELLAETLGPAVKAKGKLTTATKRVIEKCASDNLGYDCGLTRRATIHKDASVDGYHEFRQPESSSKSKRAESLAGAIKKKTGDKEPRCVVCFEINDHINHDLDNGGHLFEASVSARAVKTLEKYNEDDSDDNSEERCTATREGGRTCNLLLDHNVHQMKTAMGYHEFVGSETAVGVGGD